MDSQALEGGSQALEEGSQDLEEGSQGPEEGRLVEGGSPDLEVDRDSQPCRVSVCSALVCVAAREKVPTGYG